MKTSILGGSIVLLAFAQAVCAQSVIFNSYGNTEKNFSADFFIESYLDFTPNIGTEGARHAIPFTAPTNATWLAEELTLPLRIYDYNNTRISIVFDANGPGPLEVWSITHPPGITATPANQTYSMSVLLAPGSNYWIVVEPAGYAEGPRTYWHTGGVDVIGTLAFSSYYIGPSWGSWEFYYDYPRLPAAMLTGRPLPAVTIDILATSEVRFTTVSGSYYQVQSAPQPSATNWINEGSSFPGLGGSTSVFYSTVGVTTRVFRVLTQ